MKKSNFFNWNIFIFSFMILKKEHMDLAIQIAMIFLVFWSFAIIFAFCELGAQVTKQFNSFNEELCQCKWYLQTIEIQKMLLIFMSDAQEPVFLRGYGNILCTRDAFKDVRFSRTKNEKQIQIQ